MIAATTPSGGRSNDEASSGDLILRVAALLLVLNILLVLVKLWLSALSGSLALRAGAIHSMADIFASAALILGLRTIEGEISRHFGESPYFTILQFNLVEGGLEKQEILPNRYVRVEKGKGIKVAEMLFSHKPDCVIVGESLERKGPGYALHEAGVEVRMAEVATLAAFIEGTLREIATGRDESLPA